MQRKMAIVDFNLCRPKECGNGTCAAARSCEKKVLKQDTPGEVPESDPFLCKGCGDCVLACPRKAIRIVTG